MCKKSFLRSEVFIRRFIVVTLLAVLLWGVGSSAAHELIVKLSKMTAAKGETLPIELQSTHRFIVKEEVEDIPLIKAGMFQNGSLKDAGLKPNEPELRIDFDVKIEDDGAVLVVAAKDGECWSVTNGSNRRYGGFFEQRRKFSRARNSRFQLAQRDGFVRQGDSWGQPFVQHRRRRLLQDCEPQVQGEAAVRKEVLLCGNPALLLLSLLCLYFPERLRPISVWSSPQRL